MKVLDTYNAAAGAVIAVLSYIFGEHWALFALFLAFNVADWLTGWAKSRMAQKENSAAGWKGVLKKLLAYDRGGFWRVSRFCRDRHDTWHQFGDHCFARLVCIGVLNRQRAEIHPRKLR